MNAPTTAVPTTEIAAVVQLAADLGATGHLVAAAAVGRDLRALAGAIIGELLETAPDDRITREQVAAWGLGNDAALLASYRSLHARETDSDEGAALHALATTPPSGAGSVDVPDDLTALARYEMEHQCRAVGLLDASRLAAHARTPADWQAVGDALRAGRVAPEDASRWEGARVAATLLARGHLWAAVGQLATLACVSPVTWVSTTRRMLADDAAGPS